jgi:hypothetical protein
MRATHTCPKCQGLEILFFPQLADRDDRDQVRALALHIQEYDWKEDTEYGKLQAYVCRACGFTELYAIDAAAIPIDKKKVPGLKLLRGPKK